MAINVEDIINLVLELGAVYNSPLNYIVSMAYDLERLMQLVSNNSGLYNKVLNFLDIPSIVLNEKIQIRHNFLKQFVSKISVGTISNNKENELYSEERSTVRYICFDNIITAIREVNNIAENTDNKIQIVIADNKIRKLIKCQFGIKNIIDETQYANNPKIKQIVKVLNNIAVDSITTNNITISDISNIKHDCFITIFFDVSPSIAWSNNTGRLWFSGYERELLGLTTRIDWNNLLNISPTVYIFSKQRDLPLWQQIHVGNVEHITVAYPELYKNTTNSIMSPMAELRTELTINANGVSDLLHNPYLFYLKNILQLKAKKHFTDDMSKIFDIFSKLLKDNTAKQSLNELKNIDYFYYKKIQSFINQIPKQQSPHSYITVNGLTITYKDKKSSQNSNVTEFDHYTLSSSVPAKDIMSGYKTDLMVQALSTETNTVKFNIISPDWHSSNRINKRSIELSKEVLNEHKKNIKLAWKSFLQTDAFNLKFDKDKASSSYRHLERI